MEKKLFCTCSFNCNQQREILTFGSAFKVCFLCLHPLSRGFANLVLNNLKKKKFCSLQHKQLKKKKASSCIHFLSGQMFFLHFQQCFLWLYSRHVALHDGLSHNESSSSSLSSSSSFCFPPAFILLMQF